MQINTNTVPQNTSDEHVLPSSTASPEVVVETQRQSPASAPPPGFQPPEAQVAHVPTPPQQLGSAKMAAPAAGPAQPVGHVFNINLLFTLLLHASMASHVVTRLL